MKRRYFFLLIWGLVLWTTCNTVDTSDKNSNVPPKTANTGETRWDIPPSVVWMPKMTSPSTITGAEHEGMVVTAIRISTAGIVDSVWVSKSSKNKKADDWALKFVSQITFSPAKKEGKAVMATMDFPIVFRRTALSK